MKLIPAHAKGDYREVMSKTKDAAVFLIEYRDGFRAAVAMMNGWAYEGDGGAFTFAGQIKGQDKPVSTLFYLQQPDGSYAIVQAPMGVIVPELPPGAVPANISGQTAYEFNGVYYEPVFVNGVTQYQTFVPTG